LKENYYDVTGAVELRNALNTAFAIELPATAIMDYPTVEALTGHMASVVAPSPLGMTGAFMSKALAPRLLLSL
jgi:Phosphopantetheine attachment site